MGLMQLLTVGQSLSEARDRPHRFKLLNGAMPTFGHSNGMEGKRKADWTAEQGGAETAEYKTNLGEQAMKTETAQAVEKSEKKSGMNAYPLGRWTLKANPFKSATKPKPEPVVQGELSLDKVKVIRNDLSDSDLELVAAVKQSATADKGNVFTEPGLTAPTTVSLWAKIKGKLMRAKAQ